MNCEIFMLCCLVTWLWQLCVLILWDSLKFSVLSTDTHNWHMNIYPTCFTCLWVLRCLFCVVWYLHRLHEYICEPFCVGFFVTLPNSGFLWLILTLFTWIYFPMLYVYVRLKVPILCCLILTLVTKLANTFGCWICETPQRSGVF